MKSLFGVFATFVRAYVVATEAVVDSLVTGPLKAHVVGVIHDVAEGLTASDLLPALKAFEATVKNNETRMAELGAAIGAESAADIEIIKAALMGAKPNGKAKAPRAEKVKRN